MPPKLLLADDSITVQRVIALTFQGEGIDVTTVGDGDQAVETIDRLRPEVVFADVSMPGRDGYAVAEHVKRSEALAGTTRVVLLTGAFEPVDDRRAKAIGIDGVLAKPFEPQAAIALVRRLLTQQPVAPYSGWTDEATTTPGDAGRIPAGAGGSMAAGAGDGMNVAGGYPFETGENAGGSTSVALEDYFRRLDEALATAGLSTSPGVTQVAQSVASPQSSSDAETVVVPRPVTGTADGSASEAGSAASPQGAPTLVEAFAALLAAEEGRGEPPQALASTPAPAAVDLDALADAVARRVLEQLTDARIEEIVSARVLEVAERLVREEIDRIKAEAAS